MAPLTVSLIQSVLHWQNKPANLAMFEQKLQSIQQKTEVVILPEMFNTGFSMQPHQLAEPMDGDTIQWMKRLCWQKKIILTGSLSISENEHFYNRLIWMLPNGQMGWYDKRHLFGYAGEHEKFSAGQKRLIASVKGWRINLQVCYDLRFPVWARQVQHANNVYHGPEYDVLIYVANWPDRRANMWKTLLQARAIENQCYCIGVNRVGADGNNIYHSGNSMIVDPLGDILYQKEHDEDVFTYTLDRGHLESVRHKMPFLKDADSFKIMEM